MRIVDEKGRLFGKVNVIDFLVILFLLGILPAFYFGYKIMTRKPVVEIQEKEFVEVEEDFQCMKLKPEDLKLLSVGAKEFDAEGNLIGEILSLSESEPYVYTFNVGAGQRVIKEAPDLKQLKARLKLKVEIKPGMPYPYYKDKEIRIGSPIQFNTNGFIFSALLLEKKERKREKREERVVDLYVTLKDLDEDTLNKISVGDKEFDEKDEALAEILSLGKIENTSVEIDLGSGNFVMGEDIAKRQIATKMRLKCQIENGNQVYFKNKILKHNSPVDFKTNKYKVKGFANAGFKGELEGGSAVIATSFFLLEIDCQLIKLKPEVLNSISVGDNERDENGEVIGKIISLGESKPYQYKIDIGEKEKITKEHPILKQIEAKLKLKVEVRKDRVYYKGQLVSIASPLQFISDNFTLSAVPQGELGKMVKLEKGKGVQLKIKFFNLEPEIAEAIREGDTEKNFFNRTIAKINSVISNKPAQVLTINEDKFVKLGHPLNRDVMVYLGVGYRKKGPAYYFKNCPLKMGTKINFTSDLYSITGIILGIEMK